MTRFPLPKLSCCSLFVMCSMIPVPALAESGSGTPPGVHWQTTSQMSMEGMPYSPPPQTWKHCSPVVWTAPPTAPDDGRGCVNSAFERYENTVTWTTTCAGPPEMAGRGEIVFEDDSAQAYTGKIEYASDEGVMVINLSGSVIGTCNNPR